MKFLKSGGAGIIPSSWGGSSNPTAGPPRAARGSSTAVVTSASTVIPSPEHRTTGARLRPAGALASVCPRCGRCPFAGGVCEERVSHGRRFFLMGALALPAAATIARLSPVVPAPKRYRFSNVRVFVGDVEIKPFEMPSDDVIREEACSFMRSQLSYGGYSIEGVVRQT